MPNFDFCRTHFAGGLWALPCPWPGCPYGHDGDVYIDKRSGLADVEFRREFFIGIDDEPRFFWISPNQSYGWAIRSMVRAEQLRLARPDQGQIYHYTSLESFRGIIESEDLWLTESAFMNDASEIEHGITLAREVFDPIATNGSPIADVLRGLSSITVAERPRINLACFSTARDNLSQWRAYSGNTVGVALGFTPESLMRGLGYPSECTVTPVLYSDAQKRALLDCFARFFSEAYRRDSQRKISVRQRDASSREFYPTDGYATSLRGVFFELVACCKDAAFADEREIRMVYTEYKEIFDSIGLQPAARRFRQADGFLAPYTTVADIREIDEHQKVRSTFPLEEVLVGPHPKAEVAALSIRQFLDAHGFADVPVCRSIAPYR